MTPPCLVRLARPLPYADGTLEPGLYALRTLTEDSAVLEPLAEEEDGNVCYVGQFAATRPEPPRTYTVPVALLTHFADTGLRLPAA
jgi:hypothetical protein